MKRCIFVITHFLLASCNIFRGRFFFGLWGCIVLFHLIKVDAKIYVVELTTVIFWRFNKIIIRLKGRVLMFRRAMMSYDVYFFMSKKKVGKFFFRSFKLKKECRITFGSYWNLKRNIFYELTSSALSHIEISSHQYSSLYYVFIVIPLITVFF